MRNCWVSAGSIRHDNCCIKYPSGKWCNGPGTDGKPAKENNHDNHCVQEWSDGFYDSLFHTAWKQDIQVGAAPNLLATQSPNSRIAGGEVTATISLCAPSGHRLRETKDAGFCCSGQMKGFRECV